MYVFQLEPTSVPRGNLGLDMDASSFLLTSLVNLIVLGQRYHWRAWDNHLGGSGVTFDNIVKLWTLNATMQVDGTIRLINARKSAHHTSGLTL
jgi:hypothetical protein